MKTHQNFRFFTVGILRFKKNCQCIINFTNWKRNKFYIKNINSIPLFVRDSYCNFLNV